MNRTHKALLVFVIVVAAMLVIKKLSPPPLVNKNWLPRTPDEKMVKISETLVKVYVTPAFDFSFDIMVPGVFQHIDRRYTYDVIPLELLNGLLFQGVHRAPEGTEIKLELLAPAKIFFFFHHRVDGGYSKIFEGLENWKPCALAPQYDIYDGDHGLTMKMYQLDADAGTYYIPPTLKKNACFNIVFQSNGTQLASLHQ